jgi:tetratricopeptide (TPR) repeat protein
MKHTALLFVLGFAGLIVAGQPAWADEPVSTGDPLAGAIALLEAGDYKDAEPVFRARVDSNPKDSRAMYYLGRALFEGEDVDAAIEWLGQATELDPADSDYNLWLGRAYLQKLMTASMFKKIGLSKKVRAHYLKAVELDPDNVSARESLAGYYFNAPGIAGGSDSKGMEQIEEIRKRDPLKAHYNLAYHHIEKEKYDEAEAEYRAAMKLDPDNYQTLHRLGQLEQERADYDRALGYFERVLAAEPDNLATLYAVGRNSALSGKRTDRGLECLQLYLAGDPGSSLPDVTWAHWRMGMIYEHKGDVAQARRAYEAALKADPDNKEAQKALKKL